MRSLIGRSLWSMTRARKHIVCLHETPYYHVTVRSVRRAFLCGVDHYSGRSYEHRRDWIEQRIRVLSSLFCIDIAAYAVMSNHYHLVVRVAPDQSDTWTDEDVLRRWCSLFHGPLLVRQFLDRETLTTNEAVTVHETANIYRGRLQSLSWFMKCLNEPIARKANAEDGCTGHFWEARFHSQPLRTNDAIIRAMTYVDLNPIRSGIATTPESSDYTSYRERALSETSTSTVSKAIHLMFRRGELLRPDIIAKPLMGFATRDDKNSATRLPIKKGDYCLLIDATVRCLLPGKHSHTDSQLPSIIDHLGLSSSDWLESMASPRWARWANGSSAKEA